MNWNAIAVISILLCLLSAILVPFCAEPVKNNNRNERMFKRMYRKWKNEEKKQQ